MNKKNFLIQSSPLGNTSYTISLGSITKNVLISDKHKEIIPIKNSPTHCAISAGTDMVSQKSFLITRNLPCPLGSQNTVKPENKITTILFNPSTMQLLAQVTQKSGYTMAKGDALHTRKDNTSTKLGQILRQTVQPGSKIAKPYNKNIDEKILAQISILETSKKFSNNYKGIQIRVSGRLRGAQRARSLLLNHGRISTQSFNSALKFNKKQIPTKWGTWGSSIYLAR